jgi:probable rRNA maturation factor
MVEVNNTTSYKISRSTIELVVAKFLRAYHRQNFTVSVAVIGAARMRTLNYHYRGIDKTTDVLSFTGFNESQIKYLGEVIINQVEVKKYRKYRAMLAEIGEDYLVLSRSRKRADYLFYFLLVHGLLHLVGYNDEDEPGRKKMMSLGHKLLQTIF